MDCVNLASSGRSAGGEILFLDYNEPSFYPIFNGMAGAGRMYRLRTGSILRATNRLFSKNVRRLAMALFLCILVGLFPLLALWRFNLGQTSTSAVFLPLAYTFLLILILFAAWIAAVRSPEKAALLTCASLVFLLSYGHLYDLLENKVIFGLTIGYAKLLLVLLALFVAACLWIIRARQTPNLLILAVPAALLIGMNAIPITSYLIKVSQSTAQLDRKVSVQQGAQDLPDIYYIVLDAYARTDMIQKVTGYDNSGFIQALKARGFYVPDCAFSNYDGTVGTVSSVLNYDTLDHLANQQSDLILDNKASQTFRALGYQFVTGRGYAAFNDIQSSDVYLNYAQDKGVEDNLAQQQFLGLYLNTTLYRVLAELYKNNQERFARIPFWQLANREADQSLQEAQFWYLQNNYMFDALEKIPQRPGNYFVYAHINAPHGPYVYNADGSFRNPFMAQDERVLYKNTIIYLDQRVLQMVDAILKHSSPSPIIIIQGDHGIHKLTSGLDKHKILSAYYLPGKLNTPPYPTSTPVNDFRLILRN